MKVAILCGGFGTRLGDLTKNTPKSLVKIHGRPFIEWQLEHLAAHGYKDVVLCISHLGRQIKDVVGNRVEYSVDEPPQGTAGAIRNALPMLGDNFAVTYGDSYLELPYKEIEQQFLVSNKPSLMATYEGLDYGWSLFHTSKIPLGYSSLNDVHSALLREDAMEVVDIPHKFFDIGSTEGIRELEQHLFSKHYLRNMADICSQIDAIALSEFVAILARCKRLFIIGYGGSAANALHAAADFKKLCQIPTYTLDNIAELTATGNDKGWDWIYTCWLKRNGLSSEDALLVLSVGGGKENVSKGIVNAIRTAQDARAPILGIVGRDGGFTGDHANTCIRIPDVGEDATPYVESMQSVLCHLLVSHPRLKRNKTKWEAMS